MRHTILTLCLLSAAIVARGVEIVSTFPANGACEVCVDTHLTLTFSDSVRLGNRGFVSVYDASSGRLVDRLDMSLPAGPTEPQPNNPSATYTPVPYVYKAEDITNRNTVPGTPSGVNRRVPGRYQLDIIGGFSDAFHFYPVIVHGNTATIYFHHNMLDYGREYRVTIDRGVIVGFAGIKDKAAIRFRTKASAPASTRRTLTVSADGSGDFSTLQGAMDHIPAFASADDAWRVEVRDGDYEELVYFRNKRHVTIEGESRDGVVVHYPNNEVFNPHPADIKTNELRGTFPSRRAAVMADNCEDMTFRNLTLRTDCRGQAEGFLLNGERNLIDNVHIIGDGDALQANGSAFWHNCEIDGGGDTVLGRGPSYFNHCTLRSRGAFMWIRNTAENHGNIFNACTFVGAGDGSVIARLPSNHGKNYPHAECVLLNCTLVNIPPVGFEPIAPEAQTATLMEFNSLAADGTPIDTSRRNPVVRQLHPVRDAATIAEYFALGVKMVK